jgi:DeoR family fructose operon transcriptional repressor
MDDMFLEERQNKIVDLINELGKVSVKSLSENFKVSESTIRNDLAYLESKGLIERTHGGAIRKNRLIKEIYPDISKSINIDEKKRLAQYANSLVEDNDVIALSSGTTIFEFVKTLTNKKGLTIIVNNIQIANWLEDNTDFEIVILGGILRHHYHYVVSPLESELLKMMNIDKTFLSVNGIDFNKGITSADFETAMNYKRLVDHSINTYVLADSSKISKVSFTKVMDIKDSNIILTKDNLTNELKEEIKNYPNIKVI